MGTSVAESTVPAFATTMPIFDRLGNVYGYDMRFRCGFEAQFVEAAAGDPETTDFWNAMGFNELLGVGRAHVTFPRELLVKGVPVLFPADTLVVGVPGDVRGDAAVLDACRRLKEVGYELALDDFHPDQTDSPFLDFGDIVCMDAAAVTGGQQAALCKDLPRRGIRPMARRVDTPPLHDQAQEAGFWYFQGEFFRQPILRPGKELPTTKAHYLELLREVNKPQLAYDDLEQLIKQDVAMTYRLLRFINSAWFGLKQTVASIRHALVLLGPREVKVWASMLVLRELGEDKPKELFRRCLIRAKMAEGIAPLLAMEPQASELFLMGMFSLVEALTDIPTARVLEGLPFSQDIKMALLAQAGPFGLVYETVENYEMGRWELFAQAAAALDLPEQAVPPLFCIARKWADDALASM
jgi:EAL and modified HD-GYP domain-containing signal transduction protein